MSDPETHKTEDSKNTSDPSQLEQKEQRSLSKTTLLIFGFLIAVISLVWFIGPSTIKVFRSGVMAMQGLENVESRLLGIERDLAQIVSENNELHDQITNAYEKINSLYIKVNEGANDLELEPSISFTAVTKSEFNKELALFDSKLSDLETVLAELDDEINSTVTVDLLKDRIAVIEVLLADAEKNNANVLSVIPSDDVLSRRLRDIEDAIANILSAPDKETAAINAVAASELRLSRILDLVEIRIESLEGAITALGVAGAGARSTLVVATSQLQTKLSTSNRFTEHLAAVHALIDGEQINDPELKNALEDLKQYSSGVPTIDDLSRAFSIVAGDVVAVGLVNYENGWSSKIRLWLRNAITVRRTGDLEGNDVESIVARTELYLNSRDLAAAVNEVIRLEGESKEMVSSWLTDATARLKVDSAADKVRVRALAVISGFKSK